jgi:hypothetical protein
MQGINNSQNNPSSYYNMQVTSKDSFRKHEMQVCAFNIRPMLGKKENESSPTMKWKGRNLAKKLKKRDQPQYLCHQIKK